MEADMLKVAKECQALARKLAPLQNRAGELEPQAPIVRLFRRVASVFWKPFRKPCGRIVARDMEKIVSSLLSAGNMLEYYARPQDFTARKEAQ